MVARLQEELVQLIGTCVVCQAVRKENEKTLFSWPKNDTFGIFL